MASITVVETRPEGTIADGAAYFENSTNKFLVYDATYASWLQFASDGTGREPYTNTYSASFDGTNDYLDLGTGSALDFTSDMSISFWMYWTASSANYDWIFTKGTWNAVQYALYLTPTGSLTFGTNSGSLTIGGTASSSISLSTWHHVAITVQSGVSSGTKIYIDGTATTLSGTFTLASRSSDALFISNPTTVSGVGPFQGLIDEFAVFNSALSSTDVAALRDTGGANPVPADISSLSPVGWWRMGDNDGGTGTTVTDMGSGGNDGTLTNGASFSTTIPS